MAKGASGLTDYSELPGEKLPEMLNEKRLDLTEVAARRLIQRSLNRARSAARRLANREARGEDVTPARHAASEVGTDAMPANSDVDALHDFRVAMRRLRALERAYRPQLRAVFGKKLRERMRALITCTGAARDAEVQLEWLEVQRAAMRPNQRLGWHFLHARLLAQFAEQSARVREVVDEDFAGFESRLRQRLRKARMRDDAVLDGVDESDGDSDSGELTTGPVALAGVAADALWMLSTELTDGLAAINLSQDIDAIHPPRLLAKRARYVLDPLVDELATGPALLDSLRDWQDQLGEIHDLQVLGAALISAAEVAGARRFGGLVTSALQVEAPSAEAPPKRAHNSSDERAGLIALAARAATQRETVYQNVRAAIQRGAVERLQEQLSAVIAELTNLASVAIAGAGGDYF
jgi:CHAD domain-containing protein